MKLKTAKSNTDLLNTCKSKTIQLIFKFCWLWIISAKSNNHLLVWQLHFDNIHRFYILTITEKLHNFFCIRSICYQWRQCCRKTKEMRLIHTLGTPSNHGININYLSFLKLLSLYIFFLTHLYPFIPQCFPTYLSHYVIYLCLTI